MRSFVLRTALLAAAACQPAIAHAQSVDYATLEETMGEPVTTSVTGKPQRASEAPASIVIITREEIARSSARDIPGLLASHAGVHVNRWTTGHSDVAVRGGVQTYNARLLVLVNGRQVYLDHYGMTNWNLLGVQLEEIQQIELVRGPAGALFGFNAASAVVNIITVDPLARTSVTGSVEAGTNDYLRAAASASVPLSESVGVNVSAGHSREAERAIPTSFAAPRPEDVVSDSVSGTLVANADARTRLEVTGGHAVNRQMEFLPSQVLSAQRFIADNAGLKVNRDTDWGSVTGHVYANWLKATYGVTGSAGSPVALATDLRNRIVVGSLASLVRLAHSDTLRFGVEYRDNELDNATVQFSPRIGYRVLAASAMLDLHPTDTVSLTLAGRLDHLKLRQTGTPLAPAANVAADYDRSLTTPSFNAALLVQVGETGQLRINGGRGVQSPSLVDFGLRLPIVVVASPFPVFVTGDPNIDPAIVWSGEIGYSQQVSPGIRLEATAFYNKVTDVIASPGDNPPYALTMIGGPSVTTRLANVGSFESWGVELTASGTIAEKLRWNANYSWVHNRQDLPFPAYAFSPKLSTPTHSANAELSYDASDWFANARARYTSETGQLAFAPSGNLLMVRVQDAVSMDATLGLRITPRISLTVSGENLTDAAGVSGSPIPADRRFRAGLSFRL